MFLRSFDAFSENLQCHYHIINSRFWHGLLNPWLLLKMDSKHTHLCWHTHIHAVIYTDCLHIRCSSRKKISVYQDRHTHMNSVNRLQFQRATHAHVERRSCYLIRDHTDGRYSVRVRQPASGSAEIHVREDGNGKDGERVRYDSSALLSLSSTGFPSLFLPPCLPSLIFSVTQLWSYS